MKRFQNLTVVALLLLLPATLRAQFTNTGQDPFGIKWRQIKTANFTLVFDANFEVEAQRMAAIMDYTSGLTGNTLHQPYKKMPLLVHNHSVVSNGFVTWFPKRIEIFPIAPQDNYANGWYQQLAVHELRHVAQMNRLVRFPLNILTTCFGDIGIAAALAQTPAWYFEGDAVATETALTEAGRGREPSFDMAIRAQLVEKSEPYPFRKAVHRSFKDYVPDHYQLGYVMVAYQRSKAGNLMWEELLTSNATDPLGLNINSVYKYFSGKNRTNYYYSAMYELRDKWTKNTKSLKISEFSAPINHARNNDNYVSYNSVCLDNNNMYAVKAEFGENATIVKINPETGDETTMALPGYIISSNITAASNVLFWDEYVADARWEHKNFSQIRYYNVATKQGGYLTRKSRFFAPSCAADGRFLAVVEADNAIQYFITVLRADDGTVVSRFATPHNAEVQYPSWSANAKYIAATLVDKAGKSLVVLNVGNGQWQTVVAASYKNICNPRFYNNYVIFRATYSGIDNMYAVNLDTKAIYQVSSVRFGAFDPYVDAANNLLYFSNYTSHGHDVVVSVLDSSKWIPLSNVKPFSLGWAEALSASEPSHFNEDSVVYKTYATKRYYGLTHLLNAYMWFPAYMHKSNNSKQSALLMPGLFGFSQNLQNTLAVYGGAGYINKRAYSSLTLSYKALYPIFEASVAHGDSVSYFDTAQNVSHGKNLLFQTRVYVPFNFSRGADVIGFTPQYEYLYENKLYTYLGNVYQGLTGHTLSAYLYMYRHLAERDLMPSVGVSLYGSYAMPHAGVGVVSNASYVRGVVYVPMSFPHHVLRLSVEYQTQGIAYFYASSLDIPRGYRKKMTKIPNSDIATKFSADYVLPIAYPDITLFDVVYVRRLSGALYFETTNIHSISRLSIDQFKILHPEYKSLSYTSVGAELVGDFRLFFIPQDLQLGARFARTSIGMQVELISQVNLGLW